MNTKNHNHHHTLKQQRIKNTKFDGTSSSDDGLKTRATTATPKPPTIELNDIFISVKTTKTNHDNRLELILNTWHQLAKEQVCLFILIFFEKL